MSRRFLCTTGNSIATGIKLPPFKEAPWDSPDVHALDCLRAQLTALDLSQATSLRRLSAETNLLQRLGCDAKDEVWLLASDTGAGQVCSEALRITEQREAAAEQLSRLSRLLAEKEAAEHASGGRSVPELIAENDKLRCERAKLQDELSHCASDEQTQNLHTLESENEALRADLVETRRQRKTAEDRLARQNIAVGELETLRDQQRSWEKRIETYKAAIGHPLHPDADVTTLGLDQSGASTTRTGR